MIYEEKWDFNINLKINKMNKLETLQCIELTTKCQANNGTICYHDPITNCDYLSYESGYVRRKYSKLNWLGRKVNTIYQLNPVKKERIWTEWAGRDIEINKRILIHNPKYRLELLSRAVINYRKYLNK